MRKNEEKDLESIKRRNMFWSDAYKKNSEFLKDLVEKSPDPSEFGIWKSTLFNRFIPTYVVVTCPIMTDGSKNKVRPWNSHVVTLNLNPTAIYHRIAFTSSNERHNDDNLSWRIDSTLLRTSALGGEGFLIFDNKEYYVPLAQKFKNIKPNMVYTSHVENFDMTLSKYALSIKSELNGYTNNFIDGVVIIKTVIISKSKDYMDCHKAHDIHFHFD